MTSTVQYDRADDGVVTLTFNAPGPVNTMSEAWVADLGATLDRLEAEKETLKGVILSSAKSTFFAGADLKEFHAAMLRPAPDAAQRLFDKLTTIKALLRRLETLGKPVVAAINGSALGGGWEVALSGHHRVIVDSPKIQVGLPEVQLGLLPGGGGVVKMVRHLGLLAAMPYLAEGKLMKPADAKNLNLAETVATADDLVPAAKRFIDATPRAVQSWDVKDYKLPGGLPSSPKVAQALAIGPAMLRAKTRGCYPAPEAIFSAMVEGAQVTFDAALRIESRYFVGLATGPVARNMVGLFFDRNLVRGGASRPKGVPKGEVKKLGVLGAGMMGAGIAYVSAAKGIPVVLKDVSAEKAEGGKAYSKKLTDGRLKKGRLTADKQQALLNAITPTGDAADLAGCDLIVEAVFEKRDLKAAVTREAEPKLAPDGVMASNTSTLPITGLAEASAKPENFIGLHFFSPVDRMELVEIIKGRQTSPETLARAYDYVLQIGKTPIVVNDSRGFYTSRTFGTFVMEGAAMLDEGIPAGVVEAAGLGAGMPVGPLAVLDETSLSLSVHVMDQTKADLEAEGTPYELQPGQALVRSLANEKNRPGRAGGGGFYDYPVGGKKTLWPGLKDFEKANVSWDLQELKDRLLYRQAVETARCLVEGVLESAHDANIGSIFGIGFPAWTGGAAQFIQGSGVEAFVKRARELAAKHGPRFAPPSAAELTRALAGNGETDAKPVTDADAVKVSAPTDTAAAPTPPPAGETIPTSPADTAVPAPAGPSA